MRASLKWPAMALAVLTLVGFGPVISVWIAKVLAGWFGCAIDESGLHACQAHGHFGGVVATLSAVGSFQQTTSPVAAIAVVGWVMLLLAVLFRTARR
jgi:hypothetical protein